MDLKPTASLGLEQYTQKHLRFVSFFESCTFFEDYRFSDVSIHEKLGK